MTPPHPTGTGAGTAVPASSSTASIADPTTKTPLTRRVRLIKQHIHAGLPKRPGEEIELLQDLADWLVAEGAAQEIAPTHATALPLAPSPASTSAPSAPSTAPAPSATPSSTRKQEK